MTGPDKKTKPVVQTRTPKKKTPGTFDNLRTLPHPHPVEEILGLTRSTPSTLSTPSRPSIPSRPSSLQQPAAPERDFTKVANSIVRSAVPSGIFGEQGGKSKELYDTLYSLTRGAIVPQRKIRIPKDRLMRKAGIGSEVTMRKNLARLCASGLIIECIVPGTHGGNEYEVFLPEEVGLTPSTGSTPSSGSTTSNTRQKQEGVEALESTGSRASLNSATAIAYTDTKTSFKTNTERSDDDEAGTAELTRTAKQLIREITGKEATQLELRKISEVLEVVLLEGKIAAARTTVSSAGPFLAEHLRRRLFKKDKQQMAIESAQSEPVTPSLEAQACPDCAGVGWYYPEGKEKGMAKCRHARLREQLDMKDKDTEPAG
jgi:hypothetical protein